MLENIAMKALGVGNYGLGYGAVGVGIGVKSTGWGIKKVGEVIESAGETIEAFGRGRIEAGKLCLSLSDTPPVVVAEAVKQQGDIIDATKTGKTEPVEIAKTETVEKPAEKTETAKELSPVEAAEAYC